MAIDPLTLRALRRRLADYKSALAMIRDLKLPQGTTYDILAERHVSWRSENVVRTKLGLQLRGPQGHVRRPDSRRTLHCSPALYARLRAQRAATGLTEEQFLTQLAALWDNRNSES